MQRIESVRFLESSRSYFPKLQKNAGRQCGKSFLIGYPLITKMCGFQQWTPRTTSIVSPSHLVHIWSRHLPRKCLGYVKNSLKCLAEEYRLNNLTKLNLNTGGHQN